MVLTLPPLEVEGLNSKNLGPIIQSQEKQSILTALNSLSSYVKRKSVVRNSGLQTYLHLQSQHQCSRSPGCSTNCWYGTHSECAQVLQNCMGTRPRN